MKQYDNRTIAVSSIWFPIWVMVVVRARKKRFFDGPILTRALGGDLIASRRKSGYFPFRETELRYVDRIVPNSRFGKAYLVEEYGADADKISVSYLGVPEYGN